MRPSLSMSLVAAVALSVTVSSAYAQDHEKCYKIKDPAKIKGIVDLTTPQFGLEPGCKLGPAKYFCAPASKTVDLGRPRPECRSSRCRSTRRRLPVDRICYQVKCPVPPPPFPPDQNVTDQFGNRTLQKFKAVVRVHAGGQGSGVLRQRRHRSGRGLRQPRSRRLHGRVPGQLQLHVRDGVLLGGAAPASAGQAGSRRRVHPVQRQSRAGGGVHGELHPRRSAVRLACQPRSARSC